MNEYQDQATWWEIHTFSTTHARWVSAGPTFDTEDNAEEWAHRTFPETIEYRVRRVRGIDD